MELDRRDNEAKKSNMEMAAKSGLTLLPSSIANVVSLCTRSSSLYVRIGALVGRLALHGAHNSTLTGLELGQSFMENILNRAGTNLADRSSRKLNEQKAEGLLEQSLIKLHSAITYVSFAISTGYYMSFAAVDSVFHMSHLLLTGLDRVFGSTDSSKAIASIIRLIKKEFQYPATSREGEKVGISDLLVGACGLALLQRWCRRITDAEDKSCEIVWDVIVLSNGNKADVIDDNAISLLEADSALYLPSRRGHEIIESIEREDVNWETRHEEMPETVLRERLLDELPAQTSLSVHTQTNVTKLITVIVTGAKPPIISLPPGVELIDQETCHIKNVESERDGLTIKQGTSNLAPRYRITYHVHKATLKKQDICRKICYENSSDSMINEQAVDLASGLIFPHKFKADAGKNVEKSRQTSYDNYEERSFCHNSADNLANQKRFRKPANSCASFNSSQITRKSSTKSLAKTAKNEHILSTKALDKDCNQRNQCKGSKSCLSSCVNMECETSISPKQVRGIASLDSLRLSAISDSTAAPPKNAAQTRRRRSANFTPSSDLNISEIPETSAEPSQYYTCTNNYCSRSSEPENKTNKTEFCKQCAAKSLFRVKSEKQIASTTSMSPSTVNHRRSKSYVPSIYNMQCNLLANSLSLDQPRSLFNDLDRLSRTGFVSDMFPQFHLVRNITRYVRFASASYGSHFLRFMGITRGGSGRDTDETHYEHHSFSTHTQLPPSTILLSSFVDSQGGTDSSGNTNTGVPMVHFVSLDHESKAVVLTCRGTLGFEDVLTDMTCDYDELIYCGKPYMVHKGIHASARRLLDGGGGRVMATINAALMKFPEYGLVMCGHSLGGAVSTLLAVMISEPNPTSTAFFTTSPPPLLANSPAEEPTPSRLPPGRRVHVFAYGPPATMSPSLRIATRGLVTTIINGQDVVPYLSLGLLHDLQAVALAFKTDDTGAISEVTKRVWHGLSGSLSDSWHDQQKIAYEDEDQWAYSSLKTLRACMLNPKLVPPGEVFLTETTPVFQRDGLMSGPLGRTATRVVVKYVKDVEKRFGELKFGGSMLLDHSPGRYEASLSALCNGVLKN